MSRTRPHLLVAMVSLRLVTLAAISGASEANAPSSENPLKGGAFAVDITPVKFPVIVNGMFEERTADRAVDRLFARAFVLAHGATRVAIVVVDSCMLPRELLDDAKGRASALTGIPTDHLLISATHTHSAPAAMGCLGSRADPEYSAFLAPQLARAIQLANERLQPVRIGWAKVRAPKHTFCRRYIRRPDRLLNDPFGQPTVRANMHPGFLNPDAVGPSGPVDDELSLLAMQTLDGKPLGVLANFSMHYVGSPLVSADYFGRFAEHLAKRIDGSEGSSACIVAMSQGTSGDLMGSDYSAPAATREYDRYAEELAELADGAYRQLKYQAKAPLAMQEAKLTLRRRIPDAARLQWAKSIAEKIGDRQPKGMPEIYALEQLMLAAEPERTLKLQALRIGDVGITAIPNEVFGITGLKLKLQSPLPMTFNIELANGSEGYIPPPEQHKLGGYTTWPRARPAWKLMPNRRLWRHFFSCWKQSPENRAAFCKLRMASILRRCCNRSREAIGDCATWAAMRPPMPVETRFPLATKTASRAICQARPARALLQMVNRAERPTSPADESEPMWQTCRARTASKCGSGTACRMMPPRHRLHVLPRPGP